MSVPSWERELSKTQFLYELFRLNVRIAQIVANKPKKYRASYGDYLIRICLKALRCAQSANLIYMSSSTSEADYLKRRAYLKDALSLVDNISTVAGVFLSLVAEEDGMKLEKLENE